MARPVKREIAETKQQLEEAKAIANNLIHNRRLHELAMKAVFALEDYLFELQSALRAADERKDSFK